jgi:hypothetical protein
MNVCPFWPNQSAALNLAGWTAIAPAIANSLTIG